MNINDLDKVASSYEKRWGIGVLPTLVSDSLKTKWDRQMSKLNKAIEDDCEFELPDMIEATIRGWAALEKAAIARGHKAGVSIESIWTVIGPDTGTTIHIYKDGECMPREDVGDGSIRYSLKEIGAIIETLDGVNLIKDVFSGAEVSAVE